MTTLEKYKEYMKENFTIGQAATTLYWDMATKAPAKGKEKIADITSYFYTEVYKRETSEELYEMLTELSKPEEFEKLDDIMKYSVKTQMEEFEKLKRVPQDFFTEYSKQQAMGQVAWEKAKRADDWELFAPQLEKLIEMTKQMMAYKCPDKQVYDALIDQYERGMTQDTIDRVFGELKEELVPLVNRIVASKQPDDSKFKGHFPKYAQEELCAYLLDYMGFDFERGAMAESEHPFTIDFNTNDIRITNHFHEDDAISAIYSAIHEGGHAIFAQQVNPEMEDTLAFKIDMMGLHESQSRLYENVLGRNINFWKPVYSKVQELLPGYENISLEEFYHEVNHVRNSFIRTEADELTYCFHIILRYEIERAIFIDNTPVSELPDLWNKKMQEYLGITPSNYSEGILQDMHWSDASFGYFPSYLLGSIYDGMYIAAIEKDLGPIDDVLAKGEIKKITQWLKENIHQYGAIRSSAEVLKSLGYDEVSAKPLNEYFKKKYTEIYNL